MRCPICGEDTRLLKMDGQGVNSCGECHPLTDAQKYHKLRARLFASLDAARTLCNEAYKKGDETSVWAAKAVQGQIQRMLDNMRRPE